mgnify:CR=1 FL=1
MNSKLHFYSSNLSENHFLNGKWLPIRPNTDTAMMLALSHTLITEGHHDSEFLNRYCFGFDRVLPYLLGEPDSQPKDAEWAAEITGIEATTIQELARQMAARRTMLSATWSLQRGDHGEQPFWALILLACVLGQIGLPGGGFTFGYGSTGGMGNAPPLFNPPSFSSGRNPINYAIPAPRLVDALLNPGKVIDYNGKKITETIRLEPGDQLAVGRETKEIIKLPLTVQQG